MPVLDQPLTAHETLETEALEGIVLDKITREARRIFRVLESMDQLWAVEQAEILVALKTK